MISTKKKKTAPSMTDDAVKTKTGKTWDQWFATLDKAGAEKLSHKQIVAILAEKHALEPWWQQTVTVEYEKARGLRAKHQTASGFQISRSKTMAVPVAALYQAWDDPRRRAKWLKSKHFTVRKATANKSMRITWEDQTHVEAMFYPKGAGKSQVTVQHNKLPDARSGERMKAFWGEQLDRLQQALAS